MLKVVQNPNNFLSDFIAEIKKAKKQILIQSMSVESGRVMVSIEEVLVEAVRRGVEIRINYDWVTEKFVHGDLPLLPILNFQKRNESNNLHSQIKQMFQRLEKSGVKITKTNKPNFLFSFLPFLNRNHIKMYVIDDRIAWIGGLNLFDVAFENIDLMIKTDNQKIVLALSEQFEKVNKEKAKKNYSINFDNNYSLFVDAGKMGESIIYDKAISMVRESKNNILFMSQFVPDNKLLKEIIKAAERNVAITIITSSENDIMFKKYPSKLSYLYFKFKTQKFSNIKLINLKKHAHVKLLLIDNKIALFGSHNLTFSGVLFGTEEIMLEISDQELLQQLSQFIKSL